MKKIIFILSVLFSFAVHAQQPADIKPVTKPKLQINFSQPSLALVNTQPTTTQDQNSKKTIVSLDQVQEKNEQEQIQLTYKGETYDPVAYLDRKPVFKIGNAYVFVGAIMDPKQNFTQGNH